MKTQIQIQELKIDEDVFIYATFTDPETNEQTCLKSVMWKPESGEMEKSQVKMNFYRTLGDILWKRFDPEGFPYLEEDGRTLVRAL